MSDTQNRLREKLLRTACVSPPPIVSDSLAGTETPQWLLDVGTAMRSKQCSFRKPTGATLMASHQAGCTLALRVLLDR